MPGGPCGGPGNGGNTTKDGKCIKTGIRRGKGIHADQWVCTQNKCREALGIIPKLAKQKEVNGNPTTAAPASGAVAPAAAAAAAAAGGSAPTAAAAVASRCAEDACALTSVPEAELPYAAGNLHVMVMRPVAGTAAGAASAAGEEVAVIGSRTREQRDADGRKHAIDLDYETPRKRARTAPGELETRVATARSLCVDAVNIKARAFELIKPAVADFMDDKIDEKELKKRKAQARQQAEKEHPPLARLDEAYTGYTQALAAHVRAEDALEAAVAAKDAAQAKLNAALSAVLPAAAGPSGVKAERA